MTRIISNIIVISCYKTLFCFGGLKDAKNNFFWNNLYLFKNAYFSKKQNMTTAQVLFELFKSSKFPNEYTSFNKSKTHFIPLKHFFNDDL